MPELTVASWNIHWGRGLALLGHTPFDVVEGCKRLDADVLVVQESWAPDGETSQHQEIADALGCAVVAASCGRAVIEPKPSVVDRADPERRKGTGDWCLAVLSRLPITGSAVIPLPQHRRDPSTRRVLRVDVDVDGSPLAVHGTHLAHLQMGSPLDRPALRAALAPVGQAAILIGDMNMWGWCMSWMKPAGWTRTGRGRTFPSPLPHSRIDHLISTPSVEVVHTEVVPDTSSDHLPIRARLRLA